MLNAHSRTWLSKKKRESISCFLRVVSKKARCTVLTGVLYESLIRRDRNVSKSQLNVVNEQVLTERPGT